MNPALPDDVLAALAASPELAERVTRWVRSANPAGALVDSKDAAVRVLEPHLAGHAEERFVAVALDRKLRVLAMKTLTVGTAGFTIVCTKQTYAWALAQDAHALLVAHNHPSGDSRPSAQDNDVTHRLAEAGRVLGIRLIDHIVYADRGGVYSYAEEGKLPHYATSVLSV